MRSGRAIAAPPFQACKNTPVVDSKQLPSGEALRRAGGLDLRTLDEAEEIRSHGRGRLGDGGPSDRRQRRENDRRLVGLVALPAARGRREIWRHRLLEEPG